MSKGFGFDAPAPRPKLDLEGFKPTPITETEQGRDLDAVAEKAGFVSREPVVRVEKIRKKNQIQDTVYVRAPLELTNRFKEFCNARGFSYGEGLEEIMRKAKI